MTAKEQNRKTRVSFTGRRPARWWRVPGLVLCATMALVACGDGGADVGPTGDGGASGDTMGDSPSSTSGVTPEDVAELRKGAQERDTAPSTANLPALGAGMADFGFDLLRALREDQDDENVLFSPVSLLYPLTMAWEGAREDTRTNLHAEFRMRLMDDELHEAMNALEQALTIEDEEAAMNLVNALWLDREFQVNDAWLETLARHYGAGAWLTDFRDSSLHPAIAEAINGWVSKHTRGLIEELVSDESFSVDTRAVLLNALYLKDAWRLPFDPDRTVEQARFLVPGDGDVRVPMMFLLEHFRYHEEAGVQLVTLPLETLPVDAVVILPPEGEEAAFLAGLDADELGRWRSAQEVREGYVRVPRLDLEGEPEVYRVMTEDMEMWSLFMEGDYSGIGTPDDPEAWLAISRIGHRAVLAMDEEGVEAAAATFVGVSEAGSTRPAERFEFNANRPFLLLLLHRGTDAPLMVAWITDPSRSP